MALHIKLVHCMLMYIPKILVTSKSLMEGHHQNCTGGRRLLPPTNPKGGVTDSVILSSTFVHILNDVLTMEILLKARPSEPLFGSIAERRDRRRIRAGLVR